MVALAINAAVNSNLLEVIGIIAGCLETCASIFVIIMKVITIFKAKDMTTKEKIEAFDATKKDQK